MHMKPSESEPALISVDGKKLQEEYRQTVENLGVPISYDDFKYILWPDELKYRAKLYHLRRHGD